MAASQGRIVVCKLFHISPYHLFLSRTTIASTSFHGVSVRNLSSSVKFNGDGDNDVNVSPPNPIPNRPLRGSSGGGPQMSRKIDVNVKSPKIDMNRRSSFSGKYDDQKMNKQPSASAKIPLQSSVLEFLNKSSNEIDSGACADKKKDNPLPVSSTSSINPPDTNTSASPPIETQDADEIFKKMKQTGLIPNAVAMLDGLCKDGLVKEAMNLFGLMREKGTIPDVVIYTAVVDGFCKARKPQDAIRVFNKMLTNSITPNAFTYSVLIQGLCNCNKLDEAIDISIQMLQAGHAPNVVTFVGLMDGLTREKGAEVARATIESLKQGGFFVDEEAIKKYLDQKAPSMPMVWEAIFGMKGSRSQKLF